MVPIPINRKKSLDIPYSHGFSQSPGSAHIVYGSVGRSAIADPLEFSSTVLRSPESTPLLIPPENDHFNNQNQNQNQSDINSHFVVTPHQAHKFAQEEQELLYSIDEAFDNNNQSTTTSTPTLHDQLESEIPIPITEDYGSIPVARTSTRDSVIGGPGGPRTISEVESEVLAVSKAWDSAVSEGRVSTTYKQELVFIIRNSAPLVVTFLLQYSLTVASIFSVGHLGKTQLAAVSLASMTANITGFALIQGLATCLDTLCAQAYGAGNYSLVGDYFQKCTLMIMACFLPIGVLWLNSEPLLSLFVTKDDPELAPLAASYLKIVLIGAPAYIAFECGKRFVQAQGIFHASTFVLMICAPINAILNYLLVWSPVIGIGYKGAPLAVAISQWLMATLLLLFVVFVDGRKCWDGISKTLFSSWLVMFKLAIPGVIMIEAEFFAFEILTLAASRLGTTALAAQSVVATISSLLYQVPFAMSIAASTRIANFVGASLGDAAKVSKKASLVCSIVMGTIDTCILYHFRYQIGSIFSDDQEVIDLVAKTIQVLISTTFVDAPGAVLGGILRGLGRQSIGGYLNLFFYYAVATPIGIWLAFYCDMSLSGLWLGITIGLLGIDICESLYIENIDWDQIVREAQHRQQMERIVEP